MKICILFIALLCIPETSNPNDNPIISKLYDKVKETPNESKLFERINSVVKEFNSYRNRFLMGSNKNE